MKIGISTVGSTGDVQPYLALALGLRAAKHDVKIICHLLHVPRFQQFGLNVVGCGPEVSQQELNEMLDKMLRTRNPLKQLQQLMEEAFFAEGELYYQQAKAAFADREIALCHMVDFLGAEAAAQNGIPIIGGILAPAGIPTRYDVPPNMPNLGKWLNPLIWKLMKWALKPIDKKANRFLAKLEKHPKTKVEGFHTLSDSLNLIASSSILTPTYPDLPAHFKVTGPWILENEVIQPKHLLVDFLEKYPNPVVVSFGSMGGSKGPELTKTILAALTLTGRPAVIQGGYANLFSENAPENIFFADFVSHEWLFPQAACVVHHAGAGTTTAVLRAGVPHVPVVFIADQPYFAKNLRRLGVAVPKQWYYSMTASSLAKSIDLACTDSKLKQNAQQLRSQFVAENGILEAIELIEAHFKKMKQ